VFNCIDDATQGKRLKQSMNFVAIIYSHQRDKANFKSFESACFAACSQSVVKDVLGFLSESIEKLFIITQYFIEYIVRKQTSTP